MNRIVKDGYLIDRIRQIGYELQERNNVHYMHPEAIYYNPDSKLFVLDTTSFMHQGDLTGHRWKVYIAGNEAGWKGAQYPIPGADVQLLEITETEKDLCLKLDGVYMGPHDEVLSIKDMVFRKKDLSKSTRLPIKDIRQLGELAYLQRPIF